MAKGECRDCQHYRGDTRAADQKGSCRRYPPAIVEEDERGKLRWPNVSDIEGCGEFEPRQE